MTWGLWFCLATWLWSNTQHCPGSQLHVRLRKTALITNTQWLLCRNPLAVGVAGHSVKSSRRAPHATFAMPGAGGCAADFGLNSAAHESCSGRWRVPGLCESAGDRLPVWRPTTQRRNMADQPAQEPKLKQCPGCGLEKPLSMYHKNKSKYGNALVLISCRALPVHMLCRGALQCFNACRA